MDGVEGVDGDGDEEPEHPLRTIPNSTTAIVRKRLRFGCAMRSFEMERTPVDLNPKGSDNRGIKP
jgi:hypothetical protein